MQNDWKKYIIVFFITVGLFLTALYVSNFFSNKKLDQLKGIQDKISVDILSSETQFSLLEESACKDVTSSVLSDELNTLGEKIDISEDNIGTRDDVLSLKRYYSLLEIKDYLLMKRITERCKLKTVFILYFYSSKTDCPDCDKQSLVLTALRQKYPGLRVYSFDYNLDLSAIKTMISIYKVGDNLPALVMNGETTNTYQSVEDIEKNLPELQTLLPEPESDETATTTDNKTTIKTSTSTTTKAE